jgi:hypothetical protein
MKTKTIGLFVGSLLLVMSSTPILTGQSIVNIESKRIVTDTIGWAGSAQVAFRLSKNIKTEFTLSNSAHLQYKNQKELYLFLANASLVEAGKEKFVNSGFAHLRYNRKFGPVLRWEAFAQIQYNKVLSVNQRGLLGTGPRFKLLSTEKLHLYQGTLYMFEYEEDINPDIIYRDQRISAYLSYTWLPTENFSFSGTWYFQPKIDDLGDHRVAGQVNLDFQITDRLSFTTSFNYLKDSEPPAEVPKEVYSMRNGLSFSF